MTPTQRDLRKIRKMYGCSAPRRDVNNEEEEEDELTLEAEFLREEAEVEAEEAGLDVDGESDQEEDGETGNSDGSDNPDYNLGNEDEYSQYGNGGSVSYTDDYTGY